MENCWSFVANILQWICGRHCGIENHGHTSLSLNVTTSALQRNLQVEDSLQDLSIENSFQSFMVQDTLQGLPVEGALQNFHVGDSLQNLFVKNTLQNQPIEGTFLDSSFEDSFQNLMVKDTLENLPIEDNIQNFIAEDTNLEHQRDFGTCPSTSMLDNQRRPLLDDDSLQTFQSFKTYDVFLNHRGPDVKSSFVSHLNDALISVGLNPFLDAKSLVKGHHAFHSINEALTGVGVHVAIFSKRYAESKYCLNELCDMLKSGKPIIPVYFDIDPKHLRRPHDGPFANAFIRHKTQGRGEEIIRWKAALLEVANITGFLLTEVNGDEAKLKKRIVNAILDVLSPYQYVQSPHHRVALEDSMKDVVERMDMIQDNVVKIMGIVGMGGIGKTTLATEVYNHFVKQRERFQCQSFLKDVKDNSILDMQKQLVHDVFQKDLKNNKEYISYWFDRLGSRRVLIIVDDINHRSQFDSLIPQIKTLGLGSRVLVTSRDRNLLNNITQGQSENALYEVKELTSTDSSRLFNWHAFCSEEPSDGFHDLAKEVVQACGGLPLALEVIGAFLYDKKTPNDVICWRQASKDLGMNVDISNKLKISYDSLNSQEQEMFLDISCFLVGKKENFAMKIWESCDSYRSPQLSLRILRDKSLVKIDGPEYKISMHDVLCDMGREVVMRQSHVAGERSHLWNPETSRSVVEGNQGSNQVKGLYLIGAQPHKTVAANKFATMCELQFLILQSCDVEGDFSAWPKSLKWLKWCRNSKLLELPSTMHLSNLAVLDLYWNRNLTRLWPTEFGKQVPCPQLRILFLNSCTMLKELPQDIGSLSRLQTLDMAYCKTIKTFPDSIGHLKELEYLFLDGCNHLRGLPDSIVQLCNLRVINLDRCSMLRELPELFGNLQALVTFKACASGLSKLPRTFSQLINLENIDLGHCIGLHELPTTMKHFAKLKMFNAEYTICHYLPKDFEQLHNLNMLKLHIIEEVSFLESQGSILNLCDTLEVLELTNCRGHPSNIHGFKRLETLTLNNSSLEGFFWDDQRHVRLIPITTNLNKNYASPPKISNATTELSNLETLKLTNCNYIKELSSTILGLLNLRSLTINKCPLQTLPNDFGCLHNLHLLDIDLGAAHHKATISRFMNSLSELSNLTHLTLKNCKDLQELPSSITRLQTLQILTLHGCPLQALPDNFGRLHKLHRLDIDLSANHHKPTLSKLPDSVSELSNLTYLTLKNCKDLQELPSSITRLQTLQILTLHGCPLQALPDNFGRLHKLHRLDIDLSANHHKPTISKLPDSVSELSNLTYLTLKNCKDLQGLPSSMMELQMLHSLVLHGCPLQALPDDFGRLRNLYRLDIDLSANHHKPTLSKLPDSLSELSNLTYLTLKNCKDLQGLPSSMMELQMLQSLVLHGCPLQALPDDFGARLRNLRWLDIDLGANHHKPTLSKLPDSLSELSNLTYLTLKNCKDLQGLPSSMMELQMLHSLVLHGCPLQALPDDFGRLRNLHRLDIDLGANHHKPTISKLLDSLSELSNLTYLTLKNCKDLQGLPSSMMELQMLHSLVLHGCPLQALPDDFGRLHNLHRLDIDLGANHHKPTISKLPDSLSELSNLTYLTLKNCKDLQELPSSISGLVMLHQFNMRSSKVQSLPSSIKHLTKLMVLRLEKINLLQELPESFSSLQQLKTLHLVYNRDLIELPSGFGELEALIKLNLCGCSLKDIARRDLKFGLLTSLTRLNLKYNRIVISPKIFEDLGSLQYLNMSHCRNLTTVEGLPKTLEVLDLGACHKLAFIPSIATLKKLRILSLCNCEALKHLCDLESLEALKELNLSGCSRLQCSSILSSNVVLERCYLSGSSVSISYDNDWRKIEPSHQIISYYDKSFPIATMGLTQKPIHVECGTKRCTEVIITNEEECLAIIFFIVAHDQGWSKHIQSHGCYDSRCSIEARLIRDNVQIENYELFKLQHADSKDQVYICTLRRGNSLVCNSKYGDKICLYATSKYLGWIVTVKEVAVCVVHTSKGEVGEVQITVKGGVGSTSITMSQEMMKMFSTLLLGDNLQKQNNVTIQSIEDSMKISCILVEEDSVNKSNSMWEPGVHTCNGCSMDIKNQRWHCEECADFDLCEPCHNGANADRLPKSHNLDHPMQLYTRHDA